MESRTKRKNSGSLLVRTDSVSLKADASTTSSSQRPRFMHGIYAGLLGTPRHCINSARRALCIAPCELDGVDGVQKMWMCLDLRRELQSLMAGAGNGSLKGLKKNLCMEFARAVDIPVSYVEVRDISVISEGSATRVELVLSQWKATADLNKLASDLLDQVDKNMVNVDDAGDLMKLISHVEVKGHSAVRGGGVLLLKKWHLVGVAIMICLISHYYGVFAFSTSASLGLRGSPVSSSLSSKTLRTSTQQTERPTNPVFRDFQIPQSQARRSRPISGIQQTKMLDPMTMSYLVMGCADSLLAGNAKTHTRKAKVIARRATRDTGKVQHMLAQDPYKGTETIVRFALHKAAEQTLLSCDEDERPMHNNLIKDFLEDGVNVLDKSTAQFAQNSEILHKSVNVAIKAAHMLDSVSMHHPAATGFMAIGVISGLVLSCGMWSAAEGNGQ